MGAIMNTFKITALLIGSILCGAAALLLSGCAQTAPYVTLQPVGPVNELAWWSDGSDLVFTAHNPTTKTFHGQMVCMDLPPMPLDLAPGQEWRGLGQLMNRYAHASPCQLVGLLQ